MCYNLIIGEVDCFLNIFAITSGKGGVGKSCVAAYTAAALSLTGKRVLLVEPGFGFRSLDIILGVTNSFFCDFSDVMSGRYTPQETIIKSSLWDNVFLLPGSPTPLPQPPKQQIIEPLLQKLAKDYDVVIVDDVDFRYISPALFKTIMLIVTPDYLSVRTEAMHSTALAGVSASEKLRLIINNVPTRVMPMRNVRDFDDIIDIVGAQLIGVIPHSPNLQYSSNNATHIKENSLTLDIFDNIAARLMGQSRTLLVR